MGTLFQVPILQSGLTIDTKNQHLA